MDSHGIDTSAQAPSRVVYTCWPFGGLLCGIATMGIGLITLGGTIILSARDRDGW